MPKSIESLLSFSAGEWSPTLTSRVDQQKYRSACLQLRNFIGLKTGPAVRRPGTQFEAQTKVSDFGGFSYAARLEEFEFSVNTTFMLEFGNHYVRFYSNGAQVVLGSAPTWVSGSIYPAGAFTTSPITSLIYYSAAGISGGTTDPSADPTDWVQQSIYEVPTPYGAQIALGSPLGLLSTEVFQLKFCAINDVVYINHPSHPRGKLIRYGDTNWVYQPVLDLTPPLLDQNATDITISASSATGSTLLTASAPAWLTGTYYDVGSAVLEVGVIYECNAPHTSGTFATDLANGDWTVITMFQPGHVGSYWEIANLRSSDYVEYDGTAAGGFGAGTSNTITAFGSWEVHTYGVWSADIQVQSSSDGGITWQTVRTIAGRNDRNVDIQGTASQAQLYRIVVSNVSAPPVAGPSNPRVVFECVDAFLLGIVQITQVGVINASGMSNGTTYAIQTVGTVNWGSLGAPVGFGVGTVFQYNGSGITGAGGTVTTPYLAVANVVTPLTVADDWISGFAYTAGDRVGYLGINYLALFNVTSSTNPAADPTNWSADGWPTVYWSEGAWSAIRGYPTAITCFEQRVWCGGTAFQPQRVWGTQLDDLENWDLGDQTLATDGMAFDLDAVGDGSILWMQAQDDLFCGMVSAEWVVEPGDQSGGITAQNVVAHRQSRWGSNQYVGAQVVGDALVFAQRQGYSLRQMLYSVVTNKYMSQDLTALSDQIMNQGVVQLAYQKQGQKNGILWATTQNGELVGMTYELDQEVFGWHRHFTGVESSDSFESVAVIDGKNGNDDEVWVVVRRQKGTSGTYQRCVERLNPFNWQQNQAILQANNPTYPADKNSAYYVDCGVSYVNPPTNVFSGIPSVLNGRTVVVCINGQNYGNFVVSGGSVTVPNYTWNGLTYPPTNAFIGLPFTSTLQPQNLDIDVHTGVTQGIIKKMTGLALSLYNTLSCTVTDGSKRSHTFSFTPTSDVTTPPPLFTGIKNMKDFPGDYGLSNPIIITTSDPLPLCVLSVAVSYNVAGTQ